MSLAKPTSREELKQYIRHKLGEPVNDVNVHDHQFDVAIQEAVDMWTKYHHDATEHVFVAHRITEEDARNGWVVADDTVHEVIRVLSVEGSCGSGGPEESLSFWNSGSNVSFWGGGVAGGHGHSDVGVNGMPGGMLTLYLAEQQRAYREAILEPESAIRFNRHTRRIQMESPKGNLSPGKFVVYEAFVSLEALENSSMWNDDWLKKYAVELVRYQWGVNLTKFSGGTLFGGEITLNGEGIKAEAVEAKERLEVKLIEENTAPPMMWIG